MLPRFFSPRMLPSTVWISVMPTLPFVYGDSAIKMEYAAQVKACEMMEKYTPLTRFLKIK